MCIRDSSLTAEALVPGAAAYPSDMDNPPLTAGQSYDTRLFATDFNPLNCAGKNRPINYRYRLCLSKVGLCEEMKAHATGKSQYRNTIK